MSYEGDDTQKNLTELDLLEAILIQLKLQTAILKEMTGLEIREIDLDE